MARMFIIGAGGFGREMFAWLSQCPEWQTRWQFAGFLDDNPAALDRFSFKVGVVGSVVDFQPQAGDQFVCAIGDAQTRLRIGREMQRKGGEFPIIRHPLAVLGNDVQIGAGTILCPGSIVTSNIVLGDFVIVNINATVGHDARVGDGVTLSPHVDITGFAEVGEGAFLGSHASILPGAKVGAWSRVGAGTVVLRTVNPGATVVGVPAKQIMP